MSSDMLALIEPLFIVVVAFGLGFWQLRELNQLKRERERREREAARENETEPC
ncbi:hypothetical protein [Thalassobaculum salexigens]|uniref:hypothetical protein n=1 Tax=Thalassobaculum salexigens TaxID=455360 RepID=UPI00248E4964|nr:hypothetical protein [Thalassobaculum salexigens]